MNALFIIWAFKLVLFALYMPWVHYKLHRRSELWVHNNLLIEYQNLIEKYLRNHDSLDSYKVKIELLNEEMTNHLEKIWLLKSEHHSLLERNNVLTQEIAKIKSSSSINEIFHLGIEVLDEILEKYKSHGDKRGLGYINWTETPSRDIVFVKGKEETPSQVVPSSTPSLCTHCKKFGHTQNRCHKIGEWF